MKFFTAAVLLLALTASVRVFGADGMWFNFECDRCVYMFNQSYCPETVNDDQGRVYSKRLSTVKPQAVAR